MTTLWRRIKRHVISGKETTKVDFKLTLDLSSKAAKTEFAKDVMAIANTPGGDGYLIVGIRDEKTLSTPSLIERVTGFQSPNGDATASTAKWLMHLMTTVIEYRSSNMMKLLYLM